MQAAPENIQAGEATAPEPSLWNRQFFFLMTIAFLVYSNISVFFQYYEYLKTLPIDPKGFGILIGIFSSAALVLRPVISPFFHSGNARRYLYIGTVLVILALFSYSLVSGFWGMLCVRLLHGLAFVILGTALIAAMVDFIPRKRSAQFFGLMTIVTIIPNTIIPPVLPALNRVLGGFTHILMFFAVITLGTFPLIRGLGSPHSGAERTGGSERLTGKEILEDLMDPRVISILSAMLCLYSGYALVFFFLDGYGKSIGIPQAGLFFTMATISEIGIRLTAGSFFDRAGKAWTAIGAMSFLALVYALLVYVTDNAFFYSIGFMLGLGWGVAMPVFNGIIFDMSEQKYRGFNTNLGFQVFQAGFFLGPIIAGPVVLHWGLGRLFYISAALSLAAALVVFINLHNLKRRAPDES